MEESTTYQLRLARGMERGLEQGREQGKVEGEAIGRAEEARKLARRIGRSRFGEPDQVVEAALDAATMEALERMADRLLQAESWSELLMPDPSAP
jgi:predicted transposase YdaD